MRRVTRDDDRTGVHEHHHVEGMVDPVHNSLLDCERELLVFF